MRTVILPGKYSVVTGVERNARVDLEGHTGLQKYEVAPQCRTVNRKGIARSKRKGGVDAVLPLFLRHGQFLRDGNHDLLG